MVKMSFFFTRFTEAEKILGNYIQGELGIWEWELVYIEHIRN